MDGVGEWITDCTHIDTEPLLPVRSKSLPGDATAMTRVTAPNLTRSSVEYFMDRLMEQVARTTQMLDLPGSGDPACSASVPPTSDPPTTISELDYLRSEVKRLQRLVGDVNAEMVDAQKAAAGVYV